MKKLSLFTAALIALGVVSQASADNVVYLTGSTAFRSSVQAALAAGTGIFDATPSAAYRLGSSASGSTYMLFHGTIGGVSTYLDCYWTGSDAGMASVANVAINNDGQPLFGAPATFMKADGTVAYTTVVGDPTSAELESSSRQADIAFADTSVSSGLPAIVAANNTSPLVSYGNIAIVCFAWLKNNNSASGASAAKTAWSDLSNITTFQMQTLFAAGSCTADYLTGAPADDTTMVYLVGRNKGSGTRANVLNDSQYGLTVAVAQNTIGGGLVANADGTYPAPVLTTPLQLAACGDNGYETGGSVTTALGFPGSTTQADPFVNPYTGLNGAGWIAIGYASCSDAIKNGVTVANWLTENGVPESDGAIESGAYSYWGYENLYGRSNIAGTYQDADAQLIYNAVANSLATSGSVAANHDVGLNPAYMNCQKNTDFSTPAHN